MSVPFPTAVVTGASRGFGRAIAAAFVAADTRVLGIARDTQRALLDTYVDAFTRADPDALVSLLRADVELEMPPIPTWFTGQQAVLAFLAKRVLRIKGQWRMVPTQANSQPALVIYERAGNGQYEAYGVQVLTLIGTRIARITAFGDPSLVPTFGFKQTLAER